MNWPGENLCIKIFDTLASGVGVWLRPWSAQRDAVASAKARSIERLAQEQLRQDIKDVRSGKKTIGEGFKLIDGPAASMPPTAAEIDLIRSAYLQTLDHSRVSPQQLIEMERAINLDQIAALALEEAAEESDASGKEQPPDPDWFTQWRNRAQDVSNEDLQRLWARVIKGEVKMPGTTSIHTMEFLSRMSRADAELIARMGRFALDCRHIFIDDVYNNENSVISNFGIKLEDMLYLDDIGILNGVNGLATIAYSTEFINQGKNRVASIRCHEKALLFFAKEETQQLLTFSGYTITTIGQQLLKLANCQTNLLYLKHVANSCRNRCEKIEIVDVQERGSGYVGINPQPF